jgi:DNA (cytosine-5)-methyltransferase 1
MLQHRGLIVDNFAGGGGASTGIEAALGRAVDIAINHDEQAIRMHEVNHPGTRHIRNNIWQVDPREVTEGKPVELAWFSPDCKHFSKAKGGKPREKSIRDLAWVVVLWAQRVKPALILLENVEEFRTWGPLCDEGKPIKARQGETFDKWCKALRKAGYKLQFRELRACDYGAPTIRKRFFMIARCDGRPDRVARADARQARQRGRRRGQAQAVAHRGRDHRLVDSVPVDLRAQEAAGREDPAPHRPRHHEVRGQQPEAVHRAADASPARRARGFGRRASRDRHRRNRGEQAVVVPHITKFRSGATGHAIDEPLATVTANSFIKRPGGSAPLGRVDATLAPFATTRSRAGRTAASRIRCTPSRRATATTTPSPPRTWSTSATASGRAGASRDGRGEAAGHRRRRRHQARGGDGLPRAVQRDARGSQAQLRALGRGARVDDREEGPAAGSRHQQPAQAARHLADGQPVDEPLHTVSAGGTHMGEVRAFLLKYYGTDQDPQLGEPLHRHHQGPLRPGHRDDRGRGIRHRRHRHAHADPARAVQRAGLPARLHHRPRRRGPADHQDRAGRQVRQQRLPAARRSAGAREQCILDRKLGRAE